MDLGPYSPTILKIFLYLAAFEGNTTSDWLNRTVYPIRSCVTFKLTTSPRKRQRMFLRMISEYGPWTYSGYLSQMSPNQLQKRQEA